jgi:glycosyltransferase involved in cell wall biosynthesis
VIARAIQSVLDQGLLQLEHIVIDGGSSDGTQEELKKYHHLHLVVEPDQGMYDAINKGIKMARGELVGILNTDDRYAVGSIRTAINILQSDPKADVVWGGADMIEITHGREKIKSILYPPKNEDSSVHFLLTEIPIFNACFFRRKVFERIGPLMEHLKVAGDREFMLRAVLQGIKFHTTDTILYHYYVHAESMTYGSNPDIFEKWNLEHIRIAQYYLGRQEIKEIARNAYRRMHTNSNLSLLKIAVKRGEFVKASNLIVKGWRVDPQWPLIFFRRGVKLFRSSPGGANNDVQFKG